MAFDLIGRIKIKDDGASKALEKVKKATQNAQRATATYSSANSRLSSSQNRLSSQNDRNARSFESVEKAIKRADGTFSNFAKKAAKGIAFGAIGVGALATGAAAYGITTSAKKAMDFEAELSTIQALTGATNAEMAKMQTLALKMGANTKYNALEAAQGIEELLKAGLSPATVQAGGLESALNLATAGGLGLAEAAEIMSTALNSFRKDGLKASDAANILAGTANASATDVHDLRYSLSAVGAVADGVGLSFRDTNAALGVFANNGLKGSDAGTSLKSMLMNLSPATNNAYEVMRALGIITKDGTNTFYDANKELKSTAEIAEVLQKSLKKLTAKDRQDALREMFGTDGIRGANILFKEGAAGVQEFIKEMSKVTALDVARKKMDNAAGAVEQFKGAIETLQISALMPTMPLIKRFANAAADFVEKYTPRITAAVDKMVKQASNYLNTHFIKNPEFQKLPDLQSKIKFVFDDLKKTFNTWWNNGGRAAVQKLTSDIIALMVNGLEASIPQLTAIGVKIGQGIASGVLLGLKNLDILSAINPQNAIEKKTNQMYDSYHSLSEKATANAKKNPGQPLIKGGTITAQQPKAWYENAIDGVKSGASKFRNFVQGRAGGLDNVPYNGYPARLHKGEEVLTREEAKRHRAEKNGGSGDRPIVITGNTFHVRNESDIESIAKQLAYHLAK